jgi:uncharacterized protein YbbC (DUF1343 family)
LEEAMKLGIECLSDSVEVLSQVKKKRVALVGHPASVDQQLNHSLDIVKQHLGLNLTCAFGPQHGMHGDKQYNMEESPNYVHEGYKIPIYSLYGNIRRPTAAMMQDFDICLFDLQDVGCRIYTYVATLVYMMEACAAHGKAFYLLDRPNPVGRVVDGSYLLPEWKSFVGEVETPMQHGLTLGELGLWYINHAKLDLDFHVVAMEGYDPNKEAWPKKMPWVSPSPQLPGERPCRVYNGTVLLEATHLSEGRGTTLPLEILGAPELQVEKILSFIDDHFQHWSQYVGLRPCSFVPTFNKYQGELCRGIQIHVDTARYEHNNFRPYRLIAGVLKAIRQVQPEYPLWNNFHYEYEKERSPIHLLTGSTYFKDWVEDSSALANDFDQHLDRDGETWKQERESFLLY